MNVHNTRRISHAVDLGSIATLCQGLRLAPEIQSISRRAVQVLHILKGKIMADVMPLKPGAAFDAVVLSKVVSPYERLTVSLGLKEGRGDKPIKLEGDLCSALGRDRIGELMGEDEELVRMTGFHQIVVTEIKELEKGFTIGLTLEIRHPANPQVG